MKTALAASLAFVLSLANAGAAELKVLASAAMRPLLADLAPDFEKTGHTLVLAYDTTSAVKARIADNEDVDVIVTLRQVLDDFSGQNKVNNVTTVGRSYIAVIVPAGGPKPDISTPGAFKRALLEANAVAILDPEKGGLSGMYAARLMERLDIATVMKPKLKLMPPSDGMMAEAIANREADFGITQLVASQDQPGIEVVGVLGRQFGVDISMAAAVSANSKDRTAAAALVRFLTSRNAAPVIRRRGMEPG